MRSLRTRARLTLAGATAGLATAWLIAGPSVGAIAFGRYWG